MIIIDQKLKELEKKGKPIRVGLIGAGFAGRGFALQLLTAAPGIRLAAICNRTASYGKQAYKEAGIKDFVKTSSQKEVNEVVKDGKHVLANNPKWLCRCPDIDVIVDATYAVEQGAKIALDAFKNKKHLVLINTELDATLGPILKVYADKAGVTYTSADGDQQGALMNLYRQVKFMGFEPVMVGNIKGLIDTKRTPETQKAFADAHFQRPTMITSFADGSKISIEMTIIANATGLKVAKRGMYGPKCTHVSEAHKLFSKKELLNGGLVDYILEAEPAFGVFVLAHSDNPVRQRYMKMYKMGDGPIYTFYRHYHLSPLEAPSSVARAVLFNDATVAPIGAPVADVISYAKKNLKRGDILDGIGGFTCYGMIDNYETTRAENLLPIGLSEGCKLIKDIEMDAPITFDDVELPKGSLSVKLWKEQYDKFSK